MLSSSPQLWLHHKLHLYNTNSTLLSPKFTNPNNKFNITYCTSNSAAPPPVLRRKRRYRKQYPGEKIGITEEMRFVAMRLRNNAQVKRRKGTSTSNSDNIDDDKDDSDKDKDDDVEEESASLSDDNNKETWRPSVEGFVKYLVDSKLVFDFVERIVDQSTDVSYTYFRKTELERSEALSRDLEWFSQQDIVVPEPSNPGIAYVNYLEELAEKSPPLFLCHFYNIYFAHIAGGQVIGKQVTEKILEGKELDFFRWEGDSEELLRGVREKLNMLAEHWSRDEKNKCLRDTTKSFRFLGQIVRLIIL